MVLRAIRSRQKDRRATWQRHRPPTSKCRQRRPQITICGRQRGMYLFSHPFPSANHPTYPRSYIFTPTIRFQSTPAVFSERPHFHPSPPVFSRYRPSSTNTTRFQPTPPVFSQHRPFSANTSRFQPTPPISIQHHLFSVGTALLQPTPPVFSQHCPFSANASRFQGTPPLSIQRHPFSLGTALLQPTPPVFNQHHLFSANASHFQPTPAVFSNTSRFQPTPPIDRPLDPPATYFDPPLPPQPIYHPFQHITAHFNSPPPILTCHYLL
ncbi:hypothetical protein BYT27DRAFT_6754668 [Phlegmacium glaucopus]|nr:hypothetical protein BYT27DRAFT_6754668 [Phlegmacium glaucopus]